MSGRERFAGNADYVDKPLIYVQNIACSVDHEYRDRHHVDQEERVFSDPFQKRAGRCLHARTIFIRLSSHCILSIRHQWAINGLSVCYDGCFNYSERC
jgi:hypothetical protein